MKLLRITDSPLIARGRCIRSSLFQKIPVSSNSNVLLGRYSSFESIAFASKEDFKARQVVEGVDRNRVRYRLEVRIRFRDFYKMERPTTSTEKTFAEKQQERMKRLRELHSKRNEARQQNHKEVIEEDKRKKLPSNWESRKRQAEWIVQDEAARQIAEEKGEDYERTKLLHIDAMEAERIARKKRRKQNPDPGFSDYEQATVRQYNRLVRNIRPNMETYEETKKKLGPVFYGDRNTILHGLHEDKKEAIDKMVTDLEKQIAKREKYSRRRMHNDDADIDYINERNARFNKKLERYYGEYTRETKLNLERGTAI